jgi:uncharacterized protein (TIGR02172 family)
MLGKPIAFGRTAEVYAWENGQILKLFHPQWGAEDAEHEARIGRALHAAGLPVPRTGEIVHINGRVGLIYEYVKGRSLVEAVRRSPWRVSVYARDFARLQGEIHSRTISGLPSQRQRLERRIRSANRIPEAVRETLLQTLRTLPEGDRICHGDFHPLNVLVTKRGFVAIDWVDATRGNPLADIARTALILELAELAQLPFILRTVRAWFYRIYLRSYRRLAPFPEGQFMAWHRLIAAARLAEDIPGEADTLLKFVQDARR